MVLALKTKQLNLLSKKQRKYPNKLKQLFTISP